MPVINLSKKDLAHLKEKYQKALEAGETEFVCTLPNESGNPFPFKFNTTYAKYLIEYLDGTETFRRK